MPGNTLPDWANSGPDAADMQADAAIMADIERAMAARGYAAPTPLPDTDNGEQVEGTVSPPPSNQATDPGTQPGGPDAGISSGDPSRQTPGADAPATVPPTGGVESPTIPPSGELPPPEPGTEVTPTEPGPLTVILESGDPFTLSQQQANYLIQLHNWVDSKSPEIKQAWAGIENGTHQAIPTEDHTAYQAWVAAGRPTAKQQTVEAPAFDTSFLPPDAVEHIARLEAQVKASQVPHSTVQPTPPAPTQAEIHALATQQANRQVQTQQALDQSTAAVREKYGLTPEQVSHLSSVTPSLNVIPSIVERYRTRSPLGDVISEAPLTKVFEEAFEIAMTTDTVLKPIHENYIVQQHAAANADTLRNVGTKKANAGSLATAPSAAVPGTEIDPRKMTPQQRHEAMVAELGEAMAQM